MNTTTRTVDGSSLYRVTVRINGAYVYHLIAAKDIQEVVTKSVYLPSIDKATEVSIDLETFITTNDIKEALLKLSFDPNINQKTNITLVLNKEFIHNKKPDMYIYTARIVNKQKEE